MRTILLSIAVVLVSAGVGFAADCGPPACGEVQNCDVCGDVAACPQRCNIVCEMKKIKRTVWVVECEEFCTLSPNFDRCKRGCGIQGGCGNSCGDPCAALQNRPVVAPKCAQVRARKKLVKKEIVCEVPIYKGVVICGSAGCCNAVGIEPEKAPLEKSASAIAPTLAPAIETAPLPPVIGVAYLQALKLDK